MSRRTKPNVVHLPLAHRSGGIHKRGGETVKAALVLVGRGIRTRGVINLHLIVAVQVETAVPLGRGRDHKLRMNICILKEQV